MTGEEVGGAAVAGETETGEVDGAVAGAVPDGESDALSAVAQRLTDVPADLPARAELLDGVLATLQAELARQGHV